MQNGALILVPAAPLMLLFCFKWFFTIGHSDDRAVVAAAAAGYKLLVYIYVYIYIFIYIYIYVSAGVLV